MSAALWLTNHCGNVIQRGWSSYCNTTLTVHETDVPAVYDGRLFEIFRLQWQVSVHWHQNFSLIHATQLHRIWFFMLFAYRPVPSIVALKDLYSEKFCVRANVWWFGCCLIGYLSPYSWIAARPFLWLNHRRSGCPLTRRSQNNSCSSHAIRVQNEENMRANVARSYTESSIAVFACFLM